MAFEKKLANYLNSDSPRISQSNPSGSASPHLSEKKPLTADNIIALNSGTSAIHLALKAVGVSKGDTVICSTFTYIASASPIVYLGAEPIFIDSEPETWNMDPALLREALNILKKKPKAIIVVDAYGEMPKMQEIMSVAKEYQIPVIEDAAGAIGSEYNGKRAGTLADVGIFSFNNNKTVTGFGGGALIIQDDQTAQNIRYWASHSKGNEPYYVHNELGFNYLMSPLNAGYLMAELEQTDEKIKVKRQIFNSYLEHLQGIDCSCSYNSKSKNNRWLSVFYLNNLSINDILSLIKEAGEKGIEMRPVWKPLHQQPIFKECRKFLNGTAESFFNKGICLPSSLKITQGQVDEVIRIFKNRTLF
jgi:dTDP-4-amino-4,6-dideoxygalactose transaminase